MSKTIRLINSNLGKVRTHQTDATTWGELKTEVSDMYSGNVKAVVKENQVSLEVDTASLPEGKLSSDEFDYDFAIFFVTKESKAGADYESWDFHRLRRKVASRGMNNNNKTKAQLIADLRRTDERNTSSVDTSQLDRIEQKVNFIADAIESTLEEDYEIVFRDEITEEEMETIRSIENQL